MNILACNLWYSTFDYSSRSNSGYITQFPLCKRPSVKSNSLRRPSILIVDADIVYVNGNDVANDERNAYFVFSFTHSHWLRSSSVVIFIENNLRPALGQSDKIEAVVLSISLNLFCLFILSKGKLKWESFIPCERFKGSLGAKNALPPMNLFIKTRIIKVCIWQKESIQLIWRICLPFYVCVFRMAEDTQLVENNRKMQ